MDWYKNLYIWIGVKSSVYRWYKNPYMDWYKQLFIWIGIKSHIWIGIKICMDWSKKKAV